MRLAALSALLCACLATQDAQPQFRARTDIIRLDVSVLYPDRQPVRGLEMRHFVVLEDKVEQPIETFAEVALPEPEPLPDGWLRDTAADVVDNIDAPTGRLVAIVLDDTDRRMTTAIAEATQDIARDIVARLSPGDRGAIVFARQRRFSSVVTSDRAQLLAAIKRLEVDRSFYSEPAAQFSLASAAQSAAAALGTASDRRKIVVVVTPGVPIDMTKLLYDNDAAVYWRVDAAVGIADRDNVSIYAIDPTAMISEPLLSPKETKQRDLRRTFLKQLTEWGFGFAVVDSAGYETALDRMFREHTAYYTLGYRAPVRDLKQLSKPPLVEVRVKRQGLLVRARTTRVDRTVPPGRPRGKQPKEPPSKALRDVQLSALPQTDLRLRVAAAVFRGPGKNEGIAAITAAVGTPNEEDAVVSGDTINVAYTAIQPYPRPGEGNREPPTDYQVVAQPDGQPLEIQSHLVLRSGYQRVDIGAERVRQGRMGSIRVPLEVPDFEKDRFAMSGVVVNAADDAGTPLPAALAAILPFPPTTRRTFAASERLRVFMQVYVNGRPPLQPVTMTTRIKDGGGSFVFEATKTLAPEQFDRRGVANYTLEPPIGALSPGPYLLSIDAARDVSTLHRDVRFEIR